jgi:formate hydrogenlyase subunit 3/multisubunit Na+/H+ antiporter MnhD subunit
LLPGPAFFLLAALSAAILAYLANRWSSLAGLIAATGCLLLAWFALQQLSAGHVSVFGHALTLERSLVILGRTWTLTRSSLAALALLYTTAGATFLLSLPSRQEWSFYPFGLGMIGVLSLAVTAQQYVYAILFLWLAANLATFVLAGGRPDETTAALRFLVFTSLGVMPLLFLPHFLEPDPAGYVVAVGTGAASLPENASQIATGLMVGGMAVLLMMVPFHGQLVAIGIHSAPMSLPLMLATFPPVVLHTLFRLWQAQPALIEDPFFFQVCRWMGISAAALGGLAALGQRRWGPLVGYATLVDWGAGLIALGQGTAQGASLAVQVTFWRAWSLILIGTGWSSLFKAAGQTDELEHCGGLFRRRPLSLVVLLLGLLSLTGYPLMVGAAGRWPLLSLLAADPPGPLSDSPVWLERLIGLAPRQPEALIVLLLASVGVSVGTLVGVCACMGTKAPETTEDGAENDGNELTLPVDTTRAMRRESMTAIVSAGFALLALWLVGTVSINRQLWLKLGQELLKGVNLPGS